MRTDQGVDQPGGTAKAHEPGKSEKGVPIVSLDSLHDCSLADTRKRRGRNIDIWIPYTPHEGVCATCDDYGSTNPGLSEALLHN